MKFWERVGIAIMTLWVCFAMHQGINALMRVHNWQPLSASDWGTWVGAVGTVATLFGTIRLATSETRRRHRQELALAQLHSLAIRDRLNRANSNLKTAIAILEIALECDGDGEDLAYLVAANKELVEIPPLLIEDLVPIAAFNSKVAFLLVTVGNHLRTFQSTAFSLANDFSESDGATHRHSLTDKLRHKLIGLQEQIAPTIVALNAHVLDIDRPE